MNKTVKVTALIRNTWVKAEQIIKILLRNSVLTTSIKWDKINIRDWVKTLFILIIVNILFTSFVTLLIKMYS